MILHVFLILCVYVCVFMYSRTIAHVELMFMLIKPTLNKVYFTLLYFMVQLLAGIISLRRVLEANPGRSHGSADTLPLRHSANLIREF